MMEKKPETGNGTVKFDCTLQELFESEKRFKVLSVSDFQRTSKTRREVAIIQVNEEGGRYDVEYLCFRFFEKDDRRMLRRCRKRNGEKDECFCEHRLTFSELDDKNFFTGKSMVFVLQWGTSCVADQYYYEAVLALRLDGKLVDKQKLRIRYHHGELDLALKSFGGLYKVLPPGMLREALVHYVPCVYDNNVEDFDATYRRLYWREFWKKLFFKK